jgi:toxin-antitoxin system PIN domain toxin
LILCDVNVLIYAHRRDAHPDHLRYAEWLTHAVAGPHHFGLSEMVLSSFVRIVTNPSVFIEPTPLDHAFHFCQNLRLHPLAVPLSPGRQHWTIFEDLCRGIGARGKLVADAWHAALAIEHACTWVSTDSDFARFPHLDWQHPLSPK